ncbi:hypothetical protein [Marininema halotolerans]|uniref:Coat F domain-containing protein n=1 Tax=Marininema halotolerans TaxID=1155944 RepID=A0A1I6RLY2_9BACL|nr:hypothetical protein [Marininema halotolerans]SFS65656.1 hypothetical protein SAMN05444972_105190 [Marininema halotolerans]
MQLTSKDLNYLKDEMSWELLAFKKCFHYSQECTDPQLKQLIDQVGQMHQQHYQQLLAHLDPNGVGSAAMPPQGMLNNNSLPQ